MNGASFKVVFVFFLFLFLNDNPTGNMPSPNAPLKRMLAYTGCFSRMSTIKDIHEYLSQRLRIKEEDMRLWLYNSEVRFSVASLCYSTVFLLCFMKVYLPIVNLRHMCNIIGYMF